MKLLFWVVAIILAGISTVYAEEVKIATGHTFIKKVFDPVRCEFRTKTGIDIKIVFNDPVPALVALEKGMVDVAGASLTPEDWLESVSKSGAKVSAKGAYTYYTPAVEKLMITVNAENRVKTLSKQQLKDIFTGRTTNWKDVGGDDAPILVVWPTISSGALIIFKTKILDNEPVIKTVYDVESIGDTSDAIASTPEAIGIVTGTKAEKGIKEIAPAIERPLTLAYKGKPSPKLQKLLDFLKGEGKHLIK